MKSRLKNILPRFVAAVIIAVFTVSDSLGATSSTPLLRDLRFRVPANLGIVQELSSGNPSHNLPLLIHIQTAHGDYKVQKNVEGLLRHITQKYGTHLILLEGAVGRLEPALDRYFSNSEWNRRVAEYRAKRGQMSGVSLFLLDAPDVLEAKGIELADDYRANRAAFQDALRLSEKLQPSLDSLEYSIENLRSLLNSKKLRDFFFRHKAYEDGRTALSDWLRQLCQSAEKILHLRLTDPASQKEWPTLARLAGLQKTESEKEWTPNDIRADALAEELETLADKIENSLVEDEVSQQALGLFRDYRLLSKLFALELTPANFEKINDSIRPGKLAKRIEQIKGQSVEDTANLEDLDSLFDKAMEFYRGAKKREGAMEQSIAGAMHQAKKPVVVVTGGFHAPGLKEFFKTQSFPYAFVMPRVGEPGSELADGVSRKNYFDSILDKRPNLFTRATIEDARALSVSRSELRLLIGDRGVAADKWSRIESFVAKKTQLPWESQGGKLADELNNSPFADSYGDRFDFLDSRKPTLEIVNKSGRRWRLDLEEQTIRDISESRSESRTAAHGHNNSAESQIRQADAIINHMAQDGLDNPYLKIEALLTALYGGSTQYHTLDRHRKGREGKWIQHRYDDLVGLTHRIQVSDGQNDRIRILIKRAHEGLKALGIRSNQIVLISGKRQEIGKVLRSDPHFQNDFLHTFFGRSEKLRGVTWTPSRYERAVDFGNFKPEEAAVLRRFEDIFQPRIQMVEGEPLVLLAVHNRNRGPAKGGITYTFAAQLKGDPVFMKKFGVLKEAGLNLQELRYFLRKYHKEKTLANAFGMTTKTAVANLPYGGMKGHILFADVDENLEVRNLAGGERADDFRSRIDRNYSRALSVAGKIGADRAIPATDIESREHDMDRMADERIEYLYDEYRKALREKKPVEKWDPSFTNKDDDGKFDLVEKNTTTSLHDPLYLQIVVNYFDELRKADLPIPKWARPLADAVAAFTSKSLAHGGSVLRGVSTGWGGIHVVLKKVVEIDSPLLWGVETPVPLEVLTAKAMGAGAVGGSAIEAMIKEGVTVQGISERDRVVWKERGFALDDAETLQRLKQNTGGFLHLTLDNEYYEIQAAKKRAGAKALLQQLDVFWVPSAEKITEKAFLERHSDIYVLAAKENAITAENVDDIKADIILELANGGITNEAYYRLIQKGKIVIPDSLANASGVTVSYYEWLQNLRNERWTEEQILNGIPGVIEGLKKQMLGAVERVNKVRQEFATEFNGKKVPLDWRTAADILMIREVLAARDKKKREPRAESRVPRNPLDDLFEHWNSREALKASA